MEVALDSADTYLAGSLHAALGQQGLKQGGAHIHGPGSHQNLGNKDLVGLELLTNHVHAAEEPLLQDLPGGNAVVNGLLDQLLDHLGLAPLQILGNVVQNAHVNFLPK